MDNSKLTVENSMYKEEHLRRLQGLRLIDDDFMNKVFDGHPECVELVLRIILERSDLKVLDVKTQVFVENLPKRSVRFDVVATDSENGKYDIEIQRSDRGAGRKRARYNSSMLDRHSLEQGKDFDELPEIYVIFITENDVLNHGYAVYHIERQILETEELFDDGEHILYVNGEWRDDTPIGKLMHDFFCEKPEDMNYSLLADRARYFKESEEGREIMCRAFEELYEQGIERGIERGIEQGIEQGEMNNALENVKNLMNGMDISLEKALDLLKVKEKIRPYIIENIEK